ncbi:MAG: ABC transporter substrate-binding protein [Desulforhopalus sp.]
MKSRIFFSQFLTVLIVLSVGSVVVALAAEPILIGLNLPLSGPRETSGKSTRMGAELLKEEINGEGGVLVGGTRYPLKFIYADNETSLEKAVSGTLQLISKDRVLGVVGPNSSSRAIPAGGIAQSFKAPMISPTSTNPKTTTNRPFVFRACFLDDYQGEVMARFAVSEFKASKAAVLFDSENTYPKGLAAFFKSSFEKEKGAGSVVAYEFFKSDYSDLSSSMKKIMVSGADVLFVPQYSHELPSILKQIKAAGWEKPIIGGDAWESSDLNEKCGDLCKGLFFSAHFGAIGAKGKSKDFIDRYKAKYQQMPDGYSALGYDAANLLITAIAKLDSINKNIFVAREDVKNQLSSIKAYDGVSGVLNMNDSGDPSKSAIIIHITEDGQFESYATIAP